MRGSLAGWLLLASPIALADEDPASAVEDPPSSTQDDRERYTLQVRPGDQYTLNGSPITRSELRVITQSEAGQSGIWRIEKSPRAAGYALSSITDLLRRAGITDVVVSTEELQPEVASTAAVVVTPAPAIMVSAPPSPLSPSADVRFGGYATGLGGSEALSYGFQVNRAAAGAQAALGTNIDASVLLEAVETRGETDTGYSVRIRDAWVTIPLAASGQLTATAGVQPVIFGTQSMFNDAVDGFYTVSPSFASATVLSGLHGPRELGVSATALLQEGRGAVSAMLSNTGGTAGGDNDGQISSLRAQYQVVEPVTVVLSGRAGARNVDNTGSVIAGDLAVRLSHAAVDVLLEGAYGTEEIGVEVESTGEVLEKTFGSANAAFGLSLPLSSEQLDTIRFTGRLSYHDPSLPTVDADAWLLTGGGVLIRWAGTGEARVLSGFGYDVRTPMDANLPVNHRAMFESSLLF